MAFAESDTEAYFIDVFSQKSISDYIRDTELVSASFPL